MNATFQISAAELDATILKKIRAFTAGRNFTIVIRLEEQDVPSESAGDESVQLESPLIYTKRMLKSEANKAARTQIMTKYQHFSVDMGKFKFNRDEANER
ncbi:MAG: hypothetical protein IPM98_04870 [Lewinellaceae bacterium]|nr:hypothetical protein [Lewinellaceae bacterium]